MTLIVGLDISSTTIGISAVVINNSKITNIKYFYYKPDKSLDDIQLISKAKNDILDEVEKIQNEYSEAPIICVEDILLNTRTTTQRTITLLTAINRVICVALFERYDNVHLLPAVSVRAILRKELNQKEQIDKDHVPFAVEKIIKKSKKNWKFEFENNRNNKPREENFDKADAVAIALAIAYKEKLLKGIADEKT